MLFKRDLSRAKKRQGWERLCGVGARHGLLPARRLRGVGETPHLSLIKPLRPKPHLSGQPGGRGMSTPQHEQMRKDAA